ncbi:MAG: hypothetical protein ACYTHM_15180 [Planctomycetota bacterium]
MIAINLLGKPQGSLELEWEINELLSAKKGYSRWKWEFDVRKFERLPFCISGESERGLVRYLFNDNEVLLELTSMEGDEAEVEGTFDTKGDIRVAVGGEEYDSRGLLLEKGNPFLPENLYGLITLAIRSSKMPTPADAEAYRARMVEAVRFGRKKLRAANRYFSPIVKKVLPTAKRADPKQDFQKILKAVDFSFAGK